jgi:hypothetical protein
MGYDYERRTTGWLQRKMQIPHVCAKKARQIMSLKYMPLRMHDYDIHLEIYSEWQLPSRGY